MQVEHLDPDAGVRAADELPEAFAFDYAATSGNRRDLDGKLHVPMAPISKANVCPYYGREIPDAHALGLDAGKVYMMYRHPDELRRAADSFNHVPLLDVHTMMHADRVPRQHVVGSTGTTTSFDGTYLKTPLVVWDSDAIAGIDTRKQHQLSSSYRYRADMTPGISPDGTAYDGIMRDIVANHVALVPVGRAGADVAIGHH